MLHVKALAHPRTNRQSLAFRAVAVTYQRISGRPLKKGIATLTMGEANESSISKLHSVQEVAKLLGISSSLVYALVQKNRLPTYRIGTGRGAIRIADDDLREFLRRSRTEIEPTAKKKRKQSSRRKPLRHLKN